MNVIFFYFTLFFYSTASLGYLAFLIWAAKPLWKGARILLISGFVFHSGSIISRYFEAGYTPVTNHYEALIFFSWLMVAVYLIIQVRHSLPVIGAFVTPPALTMMLIATFRSKEIQPLDGLLDSPWFPLHVGFAYIGDALLGVSACLAIMYLIQEKQLKRKKVGAFYYRLPSLEVLDRLSYRCIGFGFLFLTLGILIGSIWLHTLQGGYIDWQDGRQTSTLLTWFLYAALLHGRLNAGWRRRRVAWMNIIGFLVILSTFLTLSHFMK